MSLNAADFQQRDLGLPGGWTRTKFGEIYELLYGKSLTKAARNTDGPYPVYGSSGIVDHHDAFLIEGPAIVVGRKGAAGAVTFSKGPCWPIDTTYYVRDCEHIDIRYSYYFLTSLRLGQFDRSTAIPGLNRDDAYDLAVNLPPLAEQRRIVAKIEELFSELDNAIENLEKAREQLTVYRQAVLKHAFEGKLTAQWRAESEDKLESPEQLLARIKKERSARLDQRLQEWKALVEDWEESGKAGKKPPKPRKPPEIADIQHDLVAALPKLPDSWAWGKLGWLTCGMEYGTSAKSAKSGTVPVVRMGNIQNAKIDWADLVFTSDGDEIAKYLLHDGDVLFNRTNSPELVGKTALYRSERPAIFAGYLIRVNHIRTVADSQYVNLFLNSHVARQYGNSVKTDGVNQSNINARKLSDYPFPYCSIEEQREMIRILEKALSLVEETEAEINRQLQKAAVLRQSILKKAFSGQLVAQDPNDEPAALLLECIRSEKLAQSHSANLRNKRRRAKAAA